jgi:hypothetical protein
LRTAFALAIGIASVALAPSASATTVTLTRVVDETTPIPGYGGTFGDLNIPSLAGTSLAFLGYTDPSGNRSGIYTASAAGIVDIADQNMTAPGSSSSFSGFNRLSFDGTNVSFNGITTANVIYTTVGGVLRLIAQAGTPAPVGGTGAIWSGFTGPLTLDGTTTVFQGATRIGFTNTAGDYEDSSGTLSRLPSFVFNGSERDLQLRGSHLAYDRSGTGAGAFDFLLGNGSATTIASTFTQVPGATAGTRFGSFQAAANGGGGSVAFVGGGGSRIGVYGGTGPSALTTYADSTMAVPGGTGKFLGFSEVAFDGTNVAFEADWGSGGTSSGIYANVGGSLVRVADASSFGSEVATTFEMGSESLSDGRLAFLVGFADNSLAIYVATFDGTAFPYTLVGAPAVPEPASLALLAIAVGLVRALARRPLLPQSASESR